MKQCLGLYHRGDVTTSPAWLPASSPLHWLKKQLFRWMSVHPRCCRAWQWPRRSAVELNEWLSAWVAVWTADFWGCYPAQEPQGVLWSVILDPELHSRRIRNPKDLWASTSLSTVTDSRSHLRETRSRSLGDVRPWRRMCRQTEPASLMSLAMTSRTPTVCLGQEEIFRRINANAKGSLQQWCRKKSKW